MSKAKSTPKQTARKLPDGMVRRHAAYYAQFSSRGRRVRKKLSTDFRVACEMLAEMRLDSYRGDAGVISNDCPLDDLLKQWKQSASQTIQPETARRYDMHVRHLNRLLTVRKVSALDLEHVECYRDERRDEGAGAGTINLEVSALGTALEWAVKRKRIASNPLPRIKRLRHEKKESRPLTLDEVNRLLEAEPSQVWRDIWFCYLTTGLRKTELMQLLFSDIDWRSRELLIRSTQAKGQRSRRIPMDDVLFAIVTALYDDRKRRRPGGRRKGRRDPRVFSRFSADHVFVTPQDAQLSGHIYDEFIPACRGAKIEMETLDASGNPVEAVTLHSLRHTCATHMISAGASPKDVQELLGHATLEMTMNIYTNVVSGGSPIRRCLASIRRGNLADTGGHSHATVALLAKKCHHSDAARF